MLRFTWDERKNRANRRKHGVGFEAGALVFKDPFVIFERDREVDGEPRWQAIGRAGGVLLLTVVHRVKVTKMRRESVSSRRVKQRRAKPQTTSRSSERVVDTDFLEKNPRIRARIKRELAALARKPADEIDLSDIPELPPPAWENPIHGLDAWLKVVRAQKLYKPVKQAVSMRLDADVVAWLKQSGPGYQTRANQILREKMLKDPPR